MDPEVGAVVIGFDQHLSFPKILKGGNYLMNRECLFIATNADENFMVDGLLIPGITLTLLSAAHRVPRPLVPTFFSGTGSLVRCMETATGRSATVIGKPNEYIKESAMRVCTSPPSRTLMIGDKLVFLPFPLNLLLPHCRFRTREKLRTRDEFRTDFVQTCYFIIQVARTWK